MSRRSGVVRWAHALLALALLGAGAPKEGRAQTPVDSLRQAVEEEWSQLLPRWREAGAAAQAARDARRARERESAQVPVDTFRVGPFQVAAVPDQVDMARQLFQEIWMEWGDVLSGSEDLFRPWIFLVHQTRGAERISLPGDSVAEVQGNWRYSGLRFRGEVLHALGRVLSSGLPDRVNAWGNGVWLSNQGFQAVARFLATAPSFVVRECYTGDLVGCRKALGLSEENLGWDDLYTPPERRIVVSRRGWPANDARRRALHEACVRGGELSACDLYLQDYWPAEAPFPRGDRPSVLLVALRLGGEGAFARLRAPGSAGESVLETLSRTAGVSPDSLLATWRAEILDSQTSAWAGLGRTPFSVLLWFVFFGFLAMRSTRWRLG